MTDEQTPQQKQWQERHLAEEAAVYRKLNDFLQFWAACPDKRCRRRRGCAGDPNVCFLPRWRAVPEEDRAWFRAVLIALDAGHDPAQAERVADEEMARRAALLANVGVSGGRLS
jgi:hypothetical protein